MGCDFFAERVIFPSVPVPGINNDQYLRACCQNLEKNWGHWKNLGEAGAYVLKDLIEKSVNFSTLATSNIRLLRVFGEVDQ